MTTTTTTGYAEAVRGALDDLPPETVAELVEGLAEHLAEVGVSDLVSLFALLGSPERYAADLRASAGLPPRAAPTRSTSLPPPVPPPPARGARPAFVLRGRLLARLALAIVVLGTLSWLVGTKDTVDPLIVLAIVVAVSAGAMAVRWLCRVADVPDHWATGVLVTIALLALAVAATAGAAHPRNSYYPPFSYPYGEPTTVGDLVLPDFAGVDAQTAVKMLQTLGLIPVVTGAVDSTSIIVSQDPPPGQYVSQGQQVDLITNRPSGSAQTFAPIPTTTPSVATTPLTTSAPAPTLAPTPTTTVPSVTPTPTSTP